MSDRVVVVAFRKFLELWIITEEIQRWASEAGVEVPAWVRVEPDTTSTERQATFRTAAEAAAFRLRWL